MKKLVSTVLATTFVLGLAMTSHAAKAIKCEVVASKENTVIMECQKARKLRVGDPVKVRKTLEGC